MNERINGIAADSPAAPPSPVAALLAAMTHEQAIATRWTGTMHDPIERDQHGRPFQAVYYYEAGFCTDAFITYATTASNTL
jgi:hypothetical protein